MTISAKIIADSISNSGKRITTFELVYPRFIHCEFNTHRTLSRNAASSRAIPVQKSISLIQDEPAMPIYWGKNQPGMSAREECDELINVTSKAPLTAVEAWNVAKTYAIQVATAFNKSGYHKQIVNRLLEPFSHIKVVCTATEFDNFFWLRRHKDAQPEIQELAENMYNEYENSVPRKLVYGSWHVPYYNEGFWESSKTITEIDTPNVDNYGMTLSDALAVSSSCCAQVSYRKLDDSLEKAKSIYERLVESMPPHFSPFEHQATPMLLNQTDFSFNGVTHIDKYRRYWSGNFCGWIQHRQFLMSKLNMEYMTSKYLGENND